MATAIERMQELQAELQCQVLEAQLSQLKRDSHLQEAAEQIGNRFGYLYDDPRFESDPRLYGGWVSRLEDRLDGRNRPVYENEDDLSEIRGDGRIIAEENDIGSGVIGILTNYCVGTGYEYDFSPKSDGDQSLSDAVQEWHDEFAQRVRWRRVEREFHDRTRPDGEAFLQLVPIPGGRCEVVFLEPDAITEPSSQSRINEYVGQISLDWSMGIATPIGQPTKPMYYFVDKTGDQRDWDVVATEFMIHGKRNVVANVKRGVSDFYPVTSSLRRAEKIMRNAGEGAALQSAIAWIREHPPGTTGTQVLSLRSGKTEIELDAPTPAGNTRTYKYQRYLPGTILDVKAGQVYKPGPMGDGKNFMDVAQAIVRYAGVRWNMPEYMITSYAGDTNFASILVADSPFVKSMESEQVWYIEEYEEIKWKMLAIAIRAGRFPGIRSLDQLKSRVQLKVQSPRVSVRNRLEETQVRAILAQNGLLSNQTWSAQEDLNYEHEKANIEEDPPMAVEQAKTEAMMRSVGTRLGFNRKTQQPQANEPGLNRKMPELGQEGRIEVAKRLLWEAYP